jgi:FAD/FMN-containing dehydrogenase
MTRRDGQRRRVWIAILATAILVGACAVRPILFLTGVAISDRDERKPLAAGMTDDASRLNATRIEEIWDMPAGDDGPAKLRDLLAWARNRHLCVSIAGARHSMGGQTIFPNGIQINMLPYHAMTLDEKNNLLDVQAGAKWADVLPFLDRHQLSVAVMQSNNSFSVGGSLSVNCHGWQPGKPPIASTVDSLRLMTADGTILRCSRGENAQLFSAVLGGYGLFGIILDAELRVVPNERYQIHQYVMATEDFMPAWKARVIASSDVGMALGRLSVVPDDFLNQAILYTFNRAHARGPLPPLSDIGFQEIARILFRGSVNSDYGKHLRWEAETQLVSHLSAKFFSRNQLLNQPVEFLENRTADSTDILQEYFVPREKFENFVASMRRIIPAGGGNLLNVTLRDVRTDNDTLLRYADRDMIALVLLFNQKITSADEARMRLLTQQLIDAALALGGRYYLPYRLEATPRQFYQAYPQANRFFTLKQQYDPSGIFQNEFYLQYDTALH